MIKLKTSARFLGENGETRVAAFKIIDYVCSLYVRAVCVAGCRLRVVSDDEAAAASGTAAVEEATRQTGETPLAAMTEEEQMAAAIAMSMGDDPAAASPQPPAAPPPIAAAAARKISLEAVRKTLFVRHGAQRLKTSSLPRQARDTHRKN